MEKTRYIITFKKFKKNCFHYFIGSNECHSKYSDNWKCTEKLCPVLKSCKKTYSNWYLRQSVSW